ncbi:MAG: ribonuclease H-like domain-containing protein [Candidatus Hadarchaeales archaeon]
MKVAYLDIETTALKANEGRIVAIGLMKGDNLEVKFGTTVEDESLMLEWLKRELEGCDLLVTWNGESFDIPFILSRAVFHGIQMRPLLQVHSLDLYEWSKSHLLLSSHRLEAVARFIGISVMGNFHGGDVPTLTKLAEGGDEDARRMIVEHCREDILLLRRVHERLRPMIGHSGWMGPAPAE